MAFSYPTNTTDVMELISWYNLVTEGWFWAFQVILLITIMFVALSTRTIREVAIAYSLWFGLVISLGFHVVGLLAAPLVIILGVLSMLAILWLFFSKKEG